METTPASQERILGEARCSLSAGPVGHVASGTSARADSDVAINGVSGSNYPGQFSSETCADTDSILSHDHSVCGHQDGICNPRGKGKGASHRASASRAVCHNGHVGCDFDGIGPIVRTDDLCRCTEYGVEVGCPCRETCYTRCRGQCLCAQVDEVAPPCQSADVLFGAVFAEHAATLFSDGEDWEQLANPRVSVEEIVAAMVTFAEGNPVEDIISQFTTKKAESETILGLYIQKFGAPQGVPELRVRFEALDLGALLCIENEQIVIDSTLEKLDGLLGDQTTDTEKEQELASPAAAVALPEVSVGSARRMQRHKKVLEMQQKIAELKVRMSSMKDGSAEYMRANTDLESMLQYVRHTMHKLERADDAEESSAPKGKTFNRSKFLRLARTATHDMSDRELSEILYSIPFKWWIQILPDSPLGNYMVKAGIKVMYTVSGTD